MHRFVLAALVVVSYAGAAVAADWPQFRGPAQAGTATGANTPSEWSGEKNLAWSVEVPGAAWSQPIVSGDKIFVTTAITENQQKPRVGGGRGGFGSPGGFGPPGGPPG